MQIFKFGGASVKDASGIMNAANVVKKHPQDKLLIVVSAIGNTTNLLEHLNTAFCNGEDSVHDLFEEIKSKHFDIIRELFQSDAASLLDEVANAFVEIDWTLEDDPHPDFDFNYDQIVSIGELVSTKIFSAYLNYIGISNEWLDVRGLIQTDNTYREGLVDWEKTRALVNSYFDNKPQGIWVTQGFLGSTSENFTTTLGRDGSDYTAAILASCTNAEAVTIWKDVPGVLNADPKWFAETQKIDKLSYREAIELTYYGANVIHPKTIKPLQNQNIPLFVRSFIDHQAPGTLINNESDILPVPSFIFKINQILISISPYDFSFMQEQNLSKIFSVFHENGVKINTMLKTAISFSVSVDHQPNKVTKLLSDLSQDFKVKYNSELELATIRHYDDETIKRVTENKVILLEVKSRYTCQLVMKNKE